MPRLSRSRAQRPAEPSPRAGFLDCAAALVLLAAMTAAAAPAAAQDNNAPTLDNPIPDQTIEAGVEWTYVFPADTFSDPDDDTLTYSLSDRFIPPDWVTFTPATRTFSGTPGAADIGIAEYSVRATDPDGASAQSIFWITVTPRLPAVTTGDVLLTNLDRAATTANITISVETAAQLFTTGDHAAGYTLGSIETAFSITPSDADKLSFSLWSVDSSGTDPRPDTKVADLTLSGSVTVISTTAFTAPAGTTLTANTSYAVVGAYSGSDTVELSKTTSDSYTSSFGFTLLSRSRRDSGSNWTHGLSDRMLMRVIGTEKGDTNAAPTLDKPLADQEAIAGQPFSFQIPADAFSDPDGDTLTYSTSNLPTWLSFDAATRTFSGTPPGSLLLVPFDVRVTATDPGGLFVQDDFDVTLFVDVPELTSGDGDVLVTNLDQAASEAAGISRNSVGQAFTTGSHAAGYTLGSIEIAFKHFDSSSTEIEKVSASLWSTTTTDSFGNVRPNMNVQALTLAGTITDTGTTRFTAPAGTTLDADTTYAVVFTYSGSDPTTFTARITDSTSETSSFGFNLADNKVIGTGSTAIVSNAPLMMRVIGAEKTAVVESCAAPDFGTREQIWTGTVTVASITGAGHGFQEGVSGALDDKTFTIGADTYTIDAALVATATNLDGDLIFSLTGSYGENMLTQQDAVRLHVCDTPYDLSDGAPEGDNLVSGFDLPRHNSYRWALDLDWSSETTRTLYLSLPANSPAAGDPTISGLGIAVGDVLTADASAITDADGLSGSFAYQWYREGEDGSNQAAIAGETASAYTLADADVGRRVRVRVSFDDRLGRAEERDSAPWPDTGTVVAASTTCAAPNLTGRRRVWSAVLTPEQTGTEPDFWGYSSLTSKGSLSPNAFSIGPTSFTFTALIAQTDTRLNILLDTGLSTAQQNALRLHVCDTAFDFSDDTDTANSAAMQITTSDIDWTDGVVRNVHLSLPANNAAVGTPTVSGTATVNQTLTADTTGITDTDGLPAAFTYQWLRENEDGTMQELIPGATSSTYDLVTADVGKRVRVRVEFTDLLGGEESVDSAAYPTTGTVGGLPTITIEADLTTAAAWVNQITYTLTREGSTADELKVNVVFTGPAGHDWGLTSGATREVTFNAGSATATLERLLRDGFFGIGFSGHATVSGVLTASIGMVSGHDLTGFDTTDTAEVSIVVPPAGEAQFRLRLTQPSYEVVEGGGPYTITMEAVARSTAIPLPNASFGVDRRTIVGTATSPGDYDGIHGGVNMTPSDCALNSDSLAVCTKTVTLTIVDDTVVEPEENFKLAISSATGSPSRRLYTERPDGTVVSGESEYPVTIRDNDLGLLGVDVTSTPLQNPDSLADPDTYGAREHIEFTARFNTPVDVSGAPTFTFDIGGTDTDATYFRGSGTDTLVFSHAVRGGNSGDLDDNGISWGANAFTGTITVAGASDAALLVHAAQSNLAGHKVDGRDTTNRYDTATVSDITVTSTPNLRSTGASVDDTYGAGEDIEITVTFTEAVTVEGDPEFRFSLTDSGGPSNNVDAAYARGSGTTALVFAYTVQATDSDDNGIWIGQYASGNRDTFQLDTDDRIRVTANNVDADLNHSQEGTQAGHKVDGSRSGNTAPTADDKTVTMDEDATYAFAAEDFNFADTDGDALASVKITQLESAGDLKLDGVDATVNQVVLKADIDADKLTFTPAANAHGAGYATFMFKVSDGTDESAAAYTMTIDVDAVNDAPTSANKTVMTEEDTPYAFKLADFAFADADAGDALDSVTVVTLPGAGKGELKLDGAPVTQNQAFPQTAVVGGQFTYTPPANANGDAFASFTFRVSDGEDESVAAYTMTVDVTPVEDAPVLATPIANQRATVGEPFSFTIPAGAFEDGDGDLLNYEATLTDDNLLPAWLMFDDTTLTFEGTPGSGDAGTLTVKVKVSDGDEEASDTFDIVVAAQTGTACPAPNFGTRRQIWTGNLTVGSVPASGGGTEYGFSPDGGALDDTTYTIGTRVRNIIALTHQLGGSANNRLRFRTRVGDGGLTDVEIAALRLHVCNTAYDFSAAVAGTTNDVFLWNAGLDWSGESTRTLYLSLPANRAATGGPGVSSDGAAVSGDTLTADPAGIADPDGLPDAFTYQWLREDADGSNPAPIPGETSATYTLTNDDVGKRVRVRVGFTDQLGSAETRESGPWPSSGAVAEDPANPVRPNTPASGAPTISGPAGGDAPRVGDTLTADIGAVDDTDGLPPAAGFGYQWVREDADGSNREDIPGANGPGYTLVPEDAGKRVSVRVTFIDEGGRTETVTSAPTAAVAARAAADDALPELVADARTVTIDWDEALDPGSVPAPGDFEVRKSDLDETGREWTLLASLAEVRVVGSTVTLRLDNRLPHDADVRVSYTPGASPVRYAGGGDAPGFAQAAAQNRTPDIEPPKVLRRDQVTVNGATLRITFSEALDPGSVPEAEGFDVNTYINVHRHESILVERVSVSGRVVTLTLARAVGGEEGVSVSYGLTGGTPIRDLAGNPSWTGGRYGADNRTVEGTAADKTLTADGDTVRVVFDAVLDAATVPGPYDFKVKGTRTSSHGYRWKKLRTETTVASIRTVAVSGSTVTLTTYNAVDHETAVRLSYVAGDSPLRFGDGTAVDGFSNLPVENRTAAPGSGRPVAQAQSEEEAQPAAAQQESAEAAAQPSGPPLTAALAARNAEHGGDPTVREAVSLRFSEAPAGLGSTELRARVSVTGGTLDAVEGSGAEFTVWFRPAGVGPVTVRLSPGGACGASGSICTPDGRALSGPAAVSIQGPIVVSVADAEAREAPGATLDFVVSLSRPAPAGRRLLLVGFRTQDGTAKDGEDYRGLRGRTYIRPGETSTTISIGVVDDAHDEGAETLTLTLSGPTSGRIGDGTATGTITNDDPMPQAWAARFGRTVAEQVLDAVESRMRASRAPGAEVSVAGRRMGLGPVLGDAQPSAGEDRAARAEAEREARGLADWLSDETDLEGRGAGERTVTGRELLLGSGFTLTAAPEAGGAMSLWGRSAVSRFEGREGDLALDGEVASGLVGADWAPVSGASTVGLVVGHSRGEGGYRAGSGDGTVRSTLTGAYPWGRHAFSERLSVWGTAGVGEGSLTLMPDEGGALRTDLGVVMGAVGFRAGGALAVTGDALGVRTTTARARGVEGSEADVTRVRLGVERSWALRFPGGMALAPSVAVGLRHDGGDAERGFGADIGGGVGWTDRRRGVTAELRGRGLLSHEASGLRERGVSGALSWEPASGGRGPRLRVSQTMGGASSGGPAALLGRGTLAGLGAGEGSDARRFELELGYGVGVLGERWTATPELGLGLTDAERELRVGGRLARRGAGKLAFEAALGVSEAGREYVLGWRLARRAVGGVGGGLELAIEATRREGSGGATRHGVGLRVGSHW